MNKKSSPLIVAMLILTGLSPAWAQQPKKIPRIGYLGNTASTSAIDMKLFRERLRDSATSRGRILQSSTGTLTERSCDCRSLPLS